MPHHSKKTNRRCTVCNRLCRGHIGPTGKNCKMNTEPVSNIDNISSSISELDSPETRTFKPHTPPAQTEPSIPLGTKGFYAGLTTVNAGKHAGINTNATNDVNQQQDPKDFILTQISKQLADMSVKLEHISERVDKNERMSTQALIESQRQSGAVRKTFSPSTHRRKVTMSKNSRSSTDSSSDDHTHRRSTRRCESTSDDSLSPDRHYSRQNTHKKASSICLANGSRVSIKKYKSAQRGEYSDLNDFLPATSLNSQMVAEVDSANNIVMRESRKGKPTITDFHSWLVAFSGFMEVLMDIKPKLWKELMTYRLAIMEYDVKYHWPAVYTYDMMFRAKLTSKCSFSYGHIDTDIVLQVLTPDNLQDQSKTCYRCGSTLHVARKCPFCPESTLETRSQEAQSQVSGNRARKGQSQRTPFSGSRNNNLAPCHNWNRGECSYGEKCYRQHICDGCGGKYPKHRCNACTSYINGRGVEHKTQGNQQTLNPNAPAFNSNSFTTQQGNMGNSTSMPSR